MPTCPHNRYGRYDRSQAAGRGFVDYRFAKMPVAYQMRFEPRRMS